jgi:hypothetical protein
MEENPWREIVLMTAAKTMASLYMTRAFRQLRDYPNVRIIPTVSERSADAARGVRRGRPTDHMPELTPDDIMYACGAPQMVDAVKDMALAAGATFYADPFTPQHGSHDTDGIVARAITWLSTTVPLPGWGGGEQIRMLPKPQTTTREERREPAYRPQQPDASPPPPMRASRPQQVPGAMRYRSPGTSYNGMPTNRIPAD